MPFLLLDVTEAVDKRCDVKEDLSAKSRFILRQADLCLARLTLSPAGSSVMIVAQIFYLGFGPMILGNTVAAILLEELVLSR